MLVSLPHLVLIEYNACLLTYLHVHRCVVCDYFEQVETTSDESYMIADGVPEYR